MCNKINENSLNRSVYLDLDTLEYIENISKAYDVALGTVIKMSIAKAMKDNF